MAPKHSHRLVRAAWINARAFTRSRPRAALSFPWACWMLLPGMLRRGLFVDATGTGMVVVCRSRPLLDLMILAPLMTASAVVLTTALGIVLPVWAVLVSVDVVILALLPGLLPLLPARGGSLLPWGPETPDGERWEIAGLAQMPGTRLTAILLAQRVIDAVPPDGAVLVATANSDELLRQYQRAGFTVGDRRRVHRRVERADAPRSTAPSRGRRSG